MQIDSGRWGREKERERELSVSSSCCFLDSISVWYAYAPPAPNCEMGLGRLPLVKYRFDLWFNLKASGGNDDNPEKSRPGWRGDNSKKCGDEPSSNLDDGLVPDDSAPPRSTVSLPPPVDCSYQRCVFPSGQTGTCTRITPETQ